MARIIIPSGPPKRPRYNEDRADPYELLGIENPGASRRGNTHYKRVRGCPREHALANIVKLRRKGDAEALTVGFAFHLALETYYLAIQRHQQERDCYAASHGAHPVVDYFWGNAAEAEAEAWAAVEGLRGVKGYEATYAELERMLGGYFDTHRRKDLWRIIAVEESLEYRDAGLEYTARLDLVVEDYDRDGMWIVEHKSARTITPDLIAGYQLDQQILGQVWLLKTCVDLESYPPLRGVLVNIATKHKRGPHCERVECLPSKYHLAAFERSLRAWFALQPEFERFGWPQALGNCAGPSRYWTKCDYYDLCYGQPHLSVGQWQRREPPFGFVKADDEAE